MMKLKLILMAAFAAFFLSGCFATNGTNRVADGGAVYRYEKTADGACSVEITSSREVIGGAMFIGDDCTLQTQTESAGGGDALNIIGTLIEKIE